MRPILALVLIGSAVLAEDAPKEPKPDSHVLAAGKAPTPYTADEIRAASPEGRTSLFRITGGGRTLLVRFRFGESDAETCRMETLQLDADKQPLAKPSSVNARWRDLQAHASFDKSSVKIGEESVEVPFGKFACLLYTVTGPKGVQRFYFAKELPGPPVKMEVEVGGQVLQTMELLEHRSFDYAKVLGEQAPGPALPAEAKLHAAVKRRGEGDDLEIVARVTGTDLPKSARLKIASGPLKGAVLDLQPTEDGSGLACARPLPSGFRMATGELDVAAHVAPPAK